MKRIIILICTISIFISCLIVPAAATGTGEVTSAYQPTFVDLFQYDYEFDRISISNGAEVARNVTRDPVINYNGTYTKVRLEWGTSEDKFTSDYIYVTVISATQPTGVYFGSSEIAGTLVGGSGDHYFYKFAVSGMYTAILRVTILMSSNFRGTVSLASAYAIIDDTAAITQAQFRTYGLMYNEGQYYQQEFANYEADLPLTYTKRFENDSYATCPDRFFVELRIPIPVTYAESFSLTFSTPNKNQSIYSDKLYESGITLIQGGSTIENLSYTTQFNIASSAYAGRNIYIHTVTVDLRGIELDNNTFLTFRFFLDKRYESNFNTNTANFYHFNVLKCGIKNGTYSKPWYVRFFYWIQEEFAALITALTDQFTSLKTAISSQFSSLKAALTEQFTSLKTAISSQFSSLKQTINSALGVDTAKPDISDQQQQIDDDVNDMDDVGDEIDDSRQELDELMPDVPDWESTGLHGFDDIVGAFIQEIHVIFLAIYANSIINQILTYTFLFALGGFILFGER